MLSALSGQGNIRFMLYEDSMNQRRLIQFMDRLVRTSDRKVFLILDNLKVRHGITKGLTLRSARLLQSSSRPSSRYRRR